MQPFLHFDSPEADINTIPEIHRRVALSQGSAVRAKLPSCLEHEFNGFTLNMFKGKNGNSFLDNICM